MAEYIDRDKVLDAVFELPPKMDAQGYGWIARGGLYQLLRDFHSADVQPVTWIPVTERLPEHLTSVIIHRKDCGIFIWEYFNTSPTDECWIDDSMNVYSFYDVTHWMPLPKPPKDGET